jgi:hypothetical protein
MLFMHYAIALHSTLLAGGLQLPGVGSSQNGPVSGLPLAWQGSVYPAAAALFLWTVVDGLAKVPYVMFLLCCTAWVLLSLLGMRVMMPLVSHKLVHNQ